jgi:hypothetical protein
MSAGKFFVRLDLDQIFLFLDGHALDIERGKRFAVVLIQLGENRVLAIEQFVQTIGLFLGIPLPDFFLEINANLVAGNRSLSCCMITGTSGHREMA